MVKRLRIHHRLNVTVVAQDTRGPPSSGGGQRAPDGGDIDGSGESLPRPPRCAPGCGVHGTCDEWRSRCDCPIGFTGEACQIATLPACQLGNHLLPIRSWILLALFRLHRGGKAKEVSDRGIGPVPCACLHALVETPFLLERTRLEDLASFEPHCVHLPPSLSLKNFLTVPAVFTNVSWHRFSFAAALAAHRLQLPASLWSETVWPMNATLLASADAHLEQQFDLRFDARDRRDAVAFARRTVRGSAPPLLRSSPAPERSRLLPLDACSSQCGGRGWCAESAESGHGQRVVCGCFTPHGLYELYEEEGHAQTDGACPFEPRASSQPGALMLSPRCLIDCGGNGACDWMGFCKCKAGFWGPDCGVTHAAHRHSLPHGPRIVRAARDPSTRARPRGTCPRIHVPTLPPLLRFGISIGEELHHRLIERVLTSDCREPTLERADYVWLLAPQFAKDVHRVLALRHHLLTAEPLGLGARYLQVLPADRAFSESLELAAPWFEVEEVWWPELSRAPHVLALRDLGCNRPARLVSPDPRLRGSEAVAAASEVAEIFVSNSLDALRPLLNRVFQRLHAMPSSVWQDDCNELDDWMPWSRTRRWAGLQFIGNRDHPVHFQQGLDVVLPVYLLGHRAQSQRDDLPSCGQMATDSPFSSNFARHSLHFNRDTLLWFGGHAGPLDNEGPRYQLWKSARNLRGVELINTRDEVRRVDETNMTLSSVFCWAPRGQGQGYASRHMGAIFHGCIPVFHGGANASHRDALPFEEVLPWSQFSLWEGNLSRLPAMLSAAAADEQRLKRMQLELACAWRALFFSSIEGSCFGEQKSRGDAFDTLMTVLTRRVRGRNNATLARSPRSACGRLRRCAQLPAHLLAEPQPASSRFTIPGPTKWLASGVGPQLRQLLAECRRDGGQWCPGQRPG